MKATKGDIVAEELGQNHAAQIYAEMLGQVCQNYYFTPDLSGNQDVTPTLLAPAIFAPSTNF
jgi:ABC-type lipoprotein export system ATPase subunit